MLEDLYTFYLETFGSGSYTSTALSQCADEFCIILTFVTVIAMLALVIGFITFCFRFIASCFTLKK